MEARLLEGFSSAPAGSMQAYQHRLIQAATPSAVSNAQDAFVAVRLGQQSWLVELSAVQEALAPPRMARIASAPKWVAGVVGVRGQVWSVIDMLALSPDEDASTGSVRVAPRGWMTLLRDPADQPGHRIALLWSDMVEVATKQDYRPVDPAETIAPGPSPDSGSDPQLPAWTRGLWEDGAGRVWRELDVAQILGEHGLVSSWRQRVDVPSPEA
jgi:chemotaxis signal transduction protein